MVEGDRLKRIEIGSHAPERNRHPVEIQAPGVVGGHVGDQKLVNAAIGKQGIAQLRAVPEADGNALGNFTAILTPAEAGVGIRRLQGENAGEGIADGDGAQLGGRKAGSIERADERAHAGAGDAVDGNVVLLHPLEHADVRKAQRASALQSHSDDGTALSSGQSRSIGGAGGLLAFHGDGKQDGGEEGCSRFPAHGGASR